MYLDGKKKLRFEQKSGFGEWKTENLLFGKISEKFEILHVVNLLDFGF